MDRDWPPLRFGRSRSAARRCASLAATGYRLGEVGELAVATGEPSVVPLVQLMAEPVAEREREQPPDPVDPEVVRRHDDAEQRRQRIEHQEPPHPPLPRQLPHHERAPHRPADVEARHRRVLVRHRLHRSRIERPRTAVLVERVHEAEVLAALFGGDPVAAVDAVVVEQPRGHQREQREADDRQRGREGQGVAPAGEVVAAAAEHPDERADRDEEVGGAVVRVPELDEPLGRERPLRRGQEPVLDRLLVVEPDRPLDPDHPHRVVERRHRLLALVDEGRAELVPHRAVDQVEDRDDERFLPPEELVLPGSARFSLFDHDA